MCAGAKASRLPCIHRLPTHTQRNYRPPPRVVRRFSQKPAAVRGWLEPTQCFATTPKIRQALHATPDAKGTPVVACAGALWRNLVSANLVHARKFQMMWAPPACVEPPHALRSPSPLTGAGSDG